MRHYFRKGVKYAHTIPLAFIVACGGGGGGETDPVSATPATQGSTAGTNNGGGTLPVSGTAGCNVPAAWTPPTTKQVVGQGTAASCTEAALRQAAQSGGHITFACGSNPVTIPVTSEIRIPNTTVMDGAGLITLDGGGKNRILVSANNRSLSVRNMRFINGTASKTMEGAGIGGAVSGEYLNRIEVINSKFENNTAGRGGGAVGVGTASTLVIVGSSFTGNSSWYGGAVYSLLSPLSIVNSVFTGNFTTTDGSLGDGGAIGTDGASTSPDDATGGDVYICGTQIVDNRGYGNGGGAYLWVYPPDRIIIDQTTVSGNRAAPNGRNNNGLGGGMRVSNGEILIRRSSFLSNISDGNGGGLYLDCAPSCTLNNDTLHGNVAKSYGGAVFGDGHSSNNVTYSANQAGGHGGAIFGAGFSVSNSVFLDNSAGNPWGQAMSCSSTGTGSHVVQWLTSSQSGGSDKCVSSITVANPLLAAPADNGGPTLTMLPAGNSPLLNAGSDCVTEDQRSKSRNTSLCDLGAVELP